MKKILLSFTGLLFLSGCSFISQTTQRFPSPAPVDTVEPGRIEGSLGYPSEGIPPGMKICATNLATQESICTSDQINDTKYIYGIGYALTVPAGNYTVIASLPDQASFHGLYSEFVTCGMTVQCPSHKLITVTVESGKTTNDINPVDWYSQQ